jgi:hypothetical protein
VRILIRLALVALVSLAVAGPVAAGPLEDGLAAHGRGDYPMAMRLWRPLADQGNADAQNNLGVMYARGQGVPQDYAAAASWYQKAADHGHPEAANNLGVMYANGRGVPQDYVTAQIWFYLAAERGNSDAEKNKTTFAAKMTSAQIWEAVKRVAAWRPGDVIAPTIPPQIARTEPSSSSPTLSAPTLRGTLIPLQLEGGTFTVPVLINDKLTLNFVLDSGSSDVSIPADVVLTLMRTGTLNAADFLGNRIYQLADGSTVPSQTFRIKSLKVGDKVIENVIGSLAPVEGSLLLGQSFLRRFKSWSIDNQRQVLVLE